MRRTVLIPAAGTGSRLGADLPKALVPVAGRPMLRHLIDLYAAIAERFVVVVSPAAEPAMTAMLREGCLLPFEVAVQPRPTGMLDAILIPRDVVAATGADRVLITWCDQVAIAPATVEAVQRSSTTLPPPDLVLPTCRMADPYVHLARDSSGRIVDVRHRREGDDMPAHGESDAGVFDLSASAYLDRLSEYARQPAIGAATGERNFVPFVAWLGERGGVVRTVPCGDEHEAVGINTPEERDRLESYLLARGTR